MSMLLQTYFDAFYPKILKTYNDMHEYSILYKLRSASTLVNGGESTQQMMNATHFSSAAQAVAHLHNIMCTTSAKELCVCATMRDSYGTYTIRYCLCIPLLFQFNAHPIELTGDAW